MSSTCSAHIVLIPYISSYISIRKNESPKCINVPNFRLIALNWIVLIIMFVFVRTRFA